MIGVVEVVGRDPAAHPQNLIKGYQHVCEVAPGAMLEEMSLPATSQFPTQLSLNLKPCNAIKACFPRRSHTLSHGALGIPVGAP